MKKSLFATALLILSVSFLSAQLSIRPQVGINSPQITEDLTSGNWDSSVGYQFGADVQIGGDTYLQLGLNFQSTKLSVTNAGDLEVSTINIPALVGFRLLPGGGLVGLRAYLGPNFAINVNESLSDSFNEITVDNIKDSSISGIVGLGVDFSSLFLDVGYNFGLTGFLESDNIDANRNIFLINAGFRIGF